MKTSRLVLMTFILCIGIHLSNAQVVSQNVDFSLKGSMTTPYDERLKGFEAKVGDILGIGGNLSFKIDSVSTLAFSTSASMFIQRDGTFTSSLNDVELRPTVSYVWSRNHSKYTIEVGSINAQPLGYKLGVKRPIYNEFSLIGKAVVQKFRTEFASGESILIGNSNSKLFLVGLEYEKVFKGGVILSVSALVGKYGQGTDLKFTKNAAFVLGYEFITAVATYTNDVPISGFPRHLVFNLGIDLLRILK